MTSSTLSLIIVQFSTLPTENEICLFEKILESRSLSYIEHSAWNNLSDNFDSATDVNFFNHNIKKYFLEKLGEVEADIYNFT